ncbi:unnamed protein product, partial [Didymodactylos carnosus]
KRELITQGDVLQEFADEGESNFNDDEGEIEHCVKAKLPFSKDETLLGWCKKHSPIYSQLGLLATSLLDVLVSSAISECFTQSDEHFIYQALIIMGIEKMISMQTYVQMTVILLKIEHALFLACYQCSMKYSNEECNNNNSTYSTECQPTFDTCMTIVLKP